MRRIMLKDIAAELDISISQVSRALNQKGEVAPEIRAKVLELARKMNYKNLSVRHDRGHRQLVFGIQRRIAQ